MEEGVLFVVEPFVSTCPNIYYDNPKLFMINKIMLLIKFLSKKELKLFNEIFERYFMLCFCDRWLLMKLKILI